MDNTKPLSPQQPLTNPGSPPVASSAPPSVGFLLNAPSLSSRPMQPAEGTTPSFSNIADVTISLGDATLPVLSALTLESTDLSKNEITNTNPEPVLQEVPEHQTALEPKRLAKLGDKDAQYQMSCFYKEGSNGFPQNLEKALHYLQLAALQNHTQACSAIGYFYVKGINFPQNTAEGIHHLTIAADAGDKAACSLLGKYYLNGEITPINLELALLYSRAAISQGGCPLTSFNLGVAYQTGLGGLDIDLAIAAFYYHLSADAPNGSLPDANYNLAIMYKQGDGVAQDYKQYMKYIFKAAGMGHELAQRSLLQFSAQLTQIHHDRERVEKGAEHN